MEKAGLPPTTGEDAAYAPGPGASEASSAERCFPAMVYAGAAVIMALADDWIAYAPGPGDSEVSLVLVLPDKENEGVEGRLAFKEETVSYAPGPGALASFPVSWGLPLMENAGAFPICAETV
jgi:hypothetical protein